MHNNIYESQNDIQFETEGVEHIPPTLLIEVT